jgi:hypothetical protein
MAFTTSIPVRDAAEDGEALPVRVAAPAEVHLGLIPDDDREGPP